jgi:hypothetical protein
MLTPSQMALCHPGCFLQVLAVKAPRDFYTLAMSQVSYKERTKTTMVTKNWTSKVGLRFPNNAHDAFLLTNRDISQEKFQHSRKKCMLRFSQKLINLLIFNYPSSTSTNVL